jgi:hypothetical protein
VYALDVVGTAVHVGGYFTNIGGRQQSYLARLSPVSVGIAPLPPPTFALAQNVPNPVRSTTRFDLSLPTGATVELAAFDLQGRRVATLLAATLPPGPHAVTWRPDGLAPGLYLVRLQVGSHAVTRKVLLIR